MNVVAVIVKNNSCVTQKILRWHLDCLNDLEWVNTTLTYHANWCLKLLAVWPDHPFI
jgi:hypothetical protein